MSYETENIVSIMTASLSDASTPSSGRELVNLSPNSQNNFWGIIQPLMYVHDFRLVPVSYFGYQMLVQYITRLVYAVIIIQLSGACSYDKN